MAECGGAPVYNERIRSECIHLLTGVSFMGLLGQFWAGAMVNEGKSAVKARQELEKWGGFSRQSTVVDNEMQRHWREA